MLNELVSELNTRGANFVKVVDISMLPANQNRGYSVTKTTPLPHKTIAIMAGLGWIGKNNLLVTKRYGCALCMCTVLTNAPLPAGNRPIVMPECGKCTVCKNACQAEAIHGSTWKIGMNRDLIVDVYHCNTCLKCLTNCPWTQKYMKKNTPT